MIELEKTYLAKYVPDLSRCEFKEIIDIYIPAAADHPVLRIRKNGEKYEITKKEPIAGDASEQKEQTIDLTHEEFTSLSRLEGKRVAKMRYYFPFEGRMTEFDVFAEQLAGLVLVDVEFTEKSDKDNFTMPEFCLVDITPEKFIAGGMICGKTYENIREKLESFGYKKLL